MSQYVETVLRALRTDTATVTLLPVDAVDTGAGHKDINQSVRIVLDVRAVSGGTPSLTLSVYGILEDDTQVFLANMTAVTAAGVSSLVIANAPRRIVVAPAISGTTPSFQWQCRCVR